jgi:hypothetical protein
MFGQKTCVKTLAPCPTHLWVEGCWFDAPALKRHHRHPLAIIVLCSSHSAAQHSTAQHSTTQQQAADPRNEEYIDRAPLHSTSEPKVCCPSLQQVRCILKCSILHGQKGTAWHSFVQVLRYECSVWLLFYLCVRAVALWPFPSTVHSYVTVHCPCRTSCKSPPTASKSSALEGGGSLHVGGDGVLCTVRTCDSSRGSFDLHHVYAALIP